MKLNAIARLGLLAAVLAVAYPAAAAVPAGVQLHQPSLPW